MNSEKELVIHPDHYNKSGRKECWDEMREIFGDEAVCIFDVLSAYKYHYRAGEKDNNPTEQDIAKIDNYLHHCADLLAITSSTQTALAKKCYRSMKAVMNKEGKKK